MFEVLETVKEVAGKSRHVRINREALVRFSQELARIDTPMPTWDSVHHFRGNDEETVAYLLVVDTINFCFWPPTGKERWEISLGPSWYSGYYALAVSLKKALESGVPIIAAHFLASLSLDQLKRILEGRGELQLMERRLDNLRELGRVLMERYEGQAHKLVAAAQGSAVKLSRLLAANLSSFRDVAVHEGLEVFLYKRAQLFAADLYGAFEGKGWGGYEDIAKLTAFADYKLPQVLRHLEILEYAPDLAHKVDRMVTLAAGSREEVEIRAHTIWSVELIRQELSLLGKPLRAFEIDWILWNLGQDEAYKAKPYHRTITIFY